jgi:hypothetical protein
VWRFLIDSCAVFLDNGTATYGLKNARDSTAGEQVFAHSGIAITTTDTEYIHDGTWNGMNETTGQIDRDSDGSINQTVTLDNQLTLVYLSLIKR